MKELQFTVQGSSSAPYEVTFVNHEDGNLSAYCTCPAGENGLYCKHRFGILEGKPKGLVSGSAEDIATVASWMPGSDIEAAMKAVEAAQKEADAAKQKVAKLKKELARAMRD